MKKSILNLILVLLAVSLVSISGCTKKEIVPAKQIPLEDFFKNPEFLSYFREKILPGIKKRGILNPHLVEGWLKTIQSLSYRDLESFWIALSFEGWASVYLDSRTDFK